MRRFHFRIMVAVLTFLIGIMGIWLGSLVPKVKIPLLARIAPKQVFKPSERGCGPNGYGQAYILSDGQMMSEGSACYDTPVVTQEELRSLLAKSSKVVERRPGFKNRFGEEGERIVFVIPDETGAERVNIIWYGGDRCYLWINAPSLDIAHAFEKADAYAY